MRNLNLPHIGMRMLKSALVVALCYWAALARNGMVLICQLSGLFCIQRYSENAWKNAKQRTIGTVIGAVYGLAYLLLRRHWNLPVVETRILEALMMAVFIIAVLYGTVVLKVTNTSYFSCVMFLSVVMNRLGDAAPYEYAWNRFLDTMIGLAIGIAVNNLELPKHKDRETLFISGLDHNLITDAGKLTDYNLVEMNRMLDDGMNFTIATKRTPAYIRESLREVRLKLPVIVMDGAAMYDIRERRYLQTYEISPVTTHRILELVREEGLQCFTNVILDDLLIIYYDELEDAVLRTVVADLRKSPYRNYLKRPVPEQHPAVYFMLMYPREVIENLRKKLEEQEYMSELRLDIYDSHKYSGYVVMKIFRKEATRANMIEHLKEYTGISKTLTIGTAAGHYDVKVHATNVNKVVHTLKKNYEYILPGGAGLI